MNVNYKENQICKLCYQIRCKQCGWIASDADAAKIQQGIITACPDCGWKPGEEVEKTLL